MQQFMVIVSNVFALRIWHAPNGNCNGLYEINNKFVYAIMIQFIGVIARSWGYLLLATRREGKRIHNAAPLRVFFTSHRPLIKIR